VAGRVGAAMQRFGPGCAIQILSERCVFGGMGTFWEVGPMASGKSWVQHTRAGEIEKAAGKNWVPRGPLPFRGEHAVSRKSRRACSAQKKSSPGSPPLHPVQGRPRLDSWMEPGPIMMHEFRRAPPSVTDNSDPVLLCHPRAPFTSMTSGTPVRPESHP
jgi:hypothetical protein